MAERHYVFDLWADWWRRHYAHGEAIIVRGSPARHRYLVARLAA